ncbi:MAG: SEC-C domain-containing protein [Nitrospirae bacterium]|nr:SEC-C domain-containing protein [Nitrospirota bacterium]
MKIIGRNDLCPCGSGKKYKKCCLAGDNQFESRRRDEAQAVQMALSWLADHYPEETAQAYYEGFMGDMTDEELELLERLPSGPEKMMRINIGEWMLADGYLLIDGKPRRAIDLILGARGPLLPVLGREWLKELGKLPMSIYEVREARPGEGLQIADLLAPAAAPVWVLERSASKSLVKWDVFGARLVRLNDVWVFSGALYPFGRGEGIDCRDEILDIIGSEKPREADMRNLVGSIIIDAWLGGLVAIDERPLPTFIDASTGDNILFTTDHYRVTDWTEFERILEAQEDVDGDRDNGWNRFVELGNGQFRSRASMMPTGSGLEVFCRTSQLADEAREWLEQIAGSVLKHKIRESVDPRSKKAIDAAKPPSSDIPPDLQRQIIHEYLAKHYEAWPETPLPALNGKSPLEAVNDKQLRPAVIELLKTIDQLEARRIQKTGGEPFDVSSLRERLGITSDKQ